MTLVKICGLSTADTVDAALGAGATHIGLNFFAKSPRAVAPERAEALARQAKGRAIRVGVFVDPDDALLDRTAPMLDAIQLHGSETPARVAEVRRRYGREVWRAAGVATQAEIGALIRDYRGAADRLLFDAKAPRDAALPGGNGVRFDWRLLAGANPPPGWGLAGGLDAGTVGEAIRGSGAPLVDVSSGVEDAPGVKSPGKIRAFVEAVGRA